MIVALALAASARTTEVAPAQSPPSAAAPQPFRDAEQAPLDYRGPGREDPEPAVSEVVIGWFGPADPQHADFGPAWRGATLALEQENAAGGYRPRREGAAAVPFTLAPAWSESPWKAGVSDLLRVVYGRRAWAVIGGVDGTTTHLAVQLALKSRFLLLSPGSTDVTADRANVPWLFTLAASDEVYAAALTRLMQQRPGARAGIVAATDHSSHATLVAVRDAMTARGLGPDVLVEVDPEAELDIAALMARLSAARCDVLVVLASPSQSGALVKRVRDAGFTGTIAGGPSTSSSAFVRAAGTSARGVLFPSSTDRGTGGIAFTREYERRWGVTPDEPATLAYDAVTIVVDAVRTAGLNRVRIRDAVRARSGRTGATGVIRWDARGRAERQVEMVTW
jgi:branched-chain amino acid transport system substrate-binding protein